jgi:formate dehydrogenase maturation protein FdhE
MGSRRAGGFADAVSHAELGPFGGAPRRPQLKIEGAKYSTVRYAEHRIAYTTIHLYRQQCRRCGDLVDAHRIVQVCQDGERKAVGVLRVCRRCELNSWMFYSRMPATARARRWSRKVVL